MAAPAITPSESGVSMTRSAPNSPYRPSVARNTPPLRPTSSPKTTTRESRAISRFNAWFTASTTVSSATVMLLKSFELSLQPSRWCGVGLAEVERRVGSRLVLRFVPGDAELVLHLFFDAIQRGLVGDSARLEMQLHSPQRVPIDPQVVKLTRLVACRIVRGRVEPKAVGHCLDKRRSFSFACAARRLAHRGVYGEEVVAIALDAGEAVGDGFLRERLRGRLLRDGRGDRPPVVLAEKDDGSPHDSCEVGGLVEIALRRATVAEDRQHDARIALQLEAPCEAHGLRKLSRDRRLERQHLQVAGHLERDRMADVPQKCHAQWISMPELTGELAILGHEPIGAGVDRHGRADRSRLLPDAWSQRDHASLSLEANRALIEPPAPEHHAISLERQLVAYREV